MTQRDKIIAMLRDAGSRGVNSYGPARKIALQLPRVIQDLQEAGYLITTRQHKDRSVDYILVSEPERSRERVKRMPAMRWDFSSDGVARQVPVEEPTQGVLFGE